MSYIAPNISYIGSCKNEFGHGYNDFKKSLIAEFNTLIQTEHDLYDHCVTFSKDHKTAFIAGHFYLTYWASYLFSKTLNLRLSCSLVFDDNNNQWLIQQLHFSLENSAGCSSD